MLIRPRPQSQRRSAQHRLLLLLLCLFLVLFFRCFHCRSSGHSCRTGSVETVMSKGGVTSSSRGAFHRCSLLTRVCVCLSLACVCLAPSAQLQATLTQCASAAEESISNALAKLRRPLNLAR